MLFQLKKIKKDNAQLYQAYRQKVSHINNQEQSLKYLFTFVQKKDSFFGSTPVVLIMKQILKVDVDCFQLYIQSMVGIKQNQISLRCLEVNLIKVENIKNIWKHQSQLRLSYSSQNSSFNQVYLNFKNEIVAEKWKNILQCKREAADLIKKQQNNILKLSEQLQRQRLKREETQRQNLAIKIIRVQQQLIYNVQDRNTQLMKSIHMQSQFNSFLINKILQKNLIIEKLKENHGIEIQASKSSILNNEQDLRNYYQSQIILHDFYNN